MPWSTSAGWPDDVSAGPAREGLRAGSRAVPVPRWLPFDEQVEGEPPDHGCAFRVAQRGAVERRQPGLDPRHPARAECCRREPVHQPRAVSRPDDLRPAPGGEDRTPRPRALRSGRVGPARWPADRRVDHRREQLVLAVDIAGQRAVRSPSGAAGTAGPARCGPTPGSGTSHPRRARSRSAVAPPIPRCSPITARAGSSPRTSPRRRPCHPPRGSTRPRRRRSTGRRH